jgi:hypothetical protein
MSFRAPVPTLNANYDGEGNSPADHPFDSIPISDSFLIVDQFLVVADTLSIFSMKLLDRFELP